MKTRALCILIFYLFFSSNVKCQTEVVKNLPDKTHAFNPKGGCGNATTNLPDYIEECDLNNISDLIIDYQFDDCGYLGCKVGDVSLELNGQLLKSKQVNAVDIKGFIYLSYLDLIEAIESQIELDAKEFCFTVTYNYKCFGGGATVTSDRFSIYESCIPLLVPGDQYERIVYDKNVSEIIVGSCIDHPAYRLCCPTDEDFIDEHTKTISIKSVIEFSDETSSTLSIQLEGSIKNDLVTLKFPISYSNDFVEKNISKYITEYSEQITLRPEKGVCKSVRPRYLLKSVTKETGTIAPCGEEEDLPIVEFLGYDLYQVTFSSCILSTCLDEKTFYVDFSQRTSKSSRNSCIGDILAELPPDSEEYNLSYSWTGPNGFTSAEKDLINVPFGTYTLVISDDCCNTYEFTYTLCTNKEYGAYYLDGEKLCRTIKCRDEGCEFEDIECVDAVICNSDQSLDKCTVDFCIDGVVVVSIEGEENSTIEYNEDEDLCIKKEYCNDHLINTSFETPSYGSWQINKEEKFCYRMVTCYDKDYENQGELTFEESFNNISEFCEIDRKCNQEYVDKIIEDPVIVSPWTININNECEREIICVEGEDGFLITGEITLYNLQYDEGFEECIAEVKCDGSTNVDGGYQAPPISIDPWDFTTDGGLVCYRKVICTDGGEFTTQYTSGTWIPIGECPEDEDQTLYVLQCGFELTEIEECILNTEAPRSNTTFNNHKVIIYPTVVSSYINIIDNKDRVSKIYIHNSAGELIKTSRGRVNRIDLTLLPSGMYIVKCKLNTGNISSYKIIKQ